MLDDANGSERASGAPLGMSCLLPRASGPHSRNVGILVRHSDRWGNVVVAAYSSPERAREAALELCSKGGFPAGSVWTVSCAME